MITHIDWKSRDNGMPIIKIYDGKRYKEFRSNRITLTPINTKVGYKFIKAKGSKECEINGRWLKCINR